MKGLRFIRGVTPFLFLCSLARPTPGCAQSLISVWGSNASSLTNVPLALTNVVAVSAGGDHALALRSDGTLFGWGMNTYGQTNIPPGLSNVTVIAAGYSHNVALRNDRTIVAW